MVHPHARHDEEQFYEASSERKNASEQRCHHDIEIPRLGWDQPWDIGGNDGKLDRLLLPIEVDLNVNNFEMQLINFYLFYLKFDNVLTLLLFLTKTSNAS